MKFLGTARAAVFTAAVVAEVAGLGLAVVPAVALTGGGGGGDGGGGHAQMTITAGGDRTTSNSVSGLGGVRFSEQHANPESCTTGGNGRCTLTLPPGDHRVNQAGAPSGWYLSPQLGISPNSNSTSAVAKDYTSLSVHVPQSGIAVPPSTSGTTTNPNARSGVWAASRNDPPPPSSCGLRVALLFDLSSSVDGHLRELQDAAVGFVDALQGTPSSVALFTMGTQAPVNLSNNSNFPLTPLTTQANVTALTNKIRGYTIDSHHAQYTNWDEGLWQIANAAGPIGGTRVHYDAVIMLNHGDPTVYGPSGIGQTHTAITRFIDVENAIFSANTLKAQGTRVIAVGTDATSASALNLRAISGPHKNSDYFTPSSHQIGSVLRDLAMENCSGTVNVTKLVIPGDRQGNTAAAVPAPRWTMSATGRTVSPPTAVTNQTGALSFGTGGQSEPVTVTETVKTGYTHFPVSGRNATCRNLAGNRVQVTNAATGPGFTVTARAGDIITCDLFNQQQAPSEVTTRLSAADGEIPVRGSATDDARLHGVTSAAGGSVQYRFYDSLAACDAEVAAYPVRAPSGGTAVSTVVVTRGTVPPSAATAFAAAGTFYWSAFYSGDPGNRAAASDCASEPLVVRPARSRVSTTLSAADGEAGVGGSVSDSATLRAVTPAASGTVQYRFYGSLSACNRDANAFPGTAPSGGTLVSTVAVTGGVAPPSAAPAFASPGTFYWAAFYSGDASNLAAASLCVTEPLVVTPAVSVVTTALSAPDGVIGIGGSASDAATLSGTTVSAAGSAQYRVYGSLGACESAVAAFPGAPPSGGTLVSTVTVTGGVVPPSAARTFASPGTFYWAAFYSGDTSNLAAASSCVTEPLVVTPAVARVTTQLSVPDRVIAVGGSASDTATLTGVTASAGGSVEYRVYDSLAGCQAAVSAFPPAGGGTLVSTGRVTGGVAQPSTAHVFASAGTFYWAAFYSGDVGNLGAASSCASEPLVVAPSIVRVTTRLSASGRVIAVGGSASDRATLTGATAAASGTVQYRFYGSAAGCETDAAAFPAKPPAGGTLVSTVAVTGGVVPSSAARAFPAAGTFYWAAFYSGDASNRGAVSSCVTEPLVVTAAVTQVSTQLSAPGGELAIGGSATDTATLSGQTGSAGGSVEYRFYGSLSACDADTAAFPGTAPAGGTLVSRVTVTNGVVPRSAAHTFPAAGTFYWAAFYSGDASNQGSPSGCLTEPLVVNPAASRVTTELSTAGRETGVGGSAGDQATLHGVTSTAGGSLEYRFYDSQSACDSETAAFPGTAPSAGTLVSTVTVTGGVVPASAVLTFPVAGTFYWAAFYFGDTNDQAAASDCATEPLVVTPAVSRVTTGLSAPAGEIPVGGSANDTAILRDVTGTAGGSVDYRFYDSLAACDADTAAFPGTAPAGGTLVSTVPVTGGAVPDSAPVTFPVAGTFYWAAFYSGDVSDQAAASDCATEPLVVTSAASEVTTQLSAAGREVPVGGSVTDKATLHGVTGTAAGSVAYRVYGSLSACTADTTAFPGTAPSGGTLVSNVTVSGGVVPASAAQAFATAGRFYWAAFYSGDTSNLASVSLCVAEPLVVTPAASQVTTKLSAADGVIGVGGSVSDTATLTGVTGSAGGSVQYRVYGTLADCQAAALAFPPASGGTLVSTVTVTSGVVPPSAMHLFGAAGTFYWAAFYSGDHDNQAAVSGCGTEALLATPALSQVTTRLSAAGAVVGVGGSVSDTATLAGVSGPAGGTVEYRFYASLSACNSDAAAFPVRAPTGGTPVSTVTVTSGVVPRSAAHLFGAAGTFYWAAFYSGDAANRAAVSSCVTEPLAVTQAESQVTTQLSAPTGEIGVGGAASDRASLHGVTATAGGSVAYRFYGSLSACETDVTGFPVTAPSGGTPVSTPPVTNAVVPASAPVTFPVSGTFYWAAFYSGDASNRAAAGDCTTEPLVVNPAASLVTTELSAAKGEVGVGGSASDAAILHGVTATAAGSVEYRFYGSLSACDSDVARFPGVAPSGGTVVSTVTVAGGVVPGSAAVTFATAGTFYWAAFYTGDTSNAAAASDCATEPLVVSPALSQVITKLSATGGVIGVGGSARDSAELLGATGTAGGSVDYRFYGSLAACQAEVARFPGTAPSGGTRASREPVTGGVPQASAFVSFPVAGTFYWAAFYSGDASNAAAASNCVTEALVVTPAPSRTTTRLSVPDRVVEVGGSADDSATLRGVTKTAGGTVEYRLYGSVSACQLAVSGFPPAGGGTLVSTERVTDGTVPPSAERAFHVPGTSYWAAFYSGDASNRPAASDCVTEPIVVTPASSEVRTRLRVIDGEIGTGGSVSDSATLTDVTGTASGSVQYRFYGSLADCQAATSAFPPAGGGTLVSTVPVTRGTVPSSDPATFEAPGRFYWAAFYSGDATNSAAASICAAESLVVTAAPQPPASVVVNLDWVIDGVDPLAPNQDPDFQASLVLDPLIPPDEPATWGEERFGYFVGQAIQVAVADIRIPPGCAHVVSGQIGAQTLTEARNEFLITITADCNKPATGPGVYTKLTLVKRISSDFAGASLVPLTSWKLTARTAPGAHPVISGTTGVTGEVEPDTRYVLAESAVPGFKQFLDPALISLVPGASGSWKCVEDNPDGTAALEDFDGGTGEVVVPPGEHVTCTAVNLQTREIPTGPVATGGGLMAASDSVPLTAAGLGLMTAGALLALTALRGRRPRRPAQKGVTS